MHAAGSTYTYEDNSNTRKLLLAVKHERGGQRDTTFDGGVEWEWRVEG